MLNHGWTAVIVASTWFFVRRGGPCLGGWTLREGMHERHRLPPGRWSVRWQWPRGHGRPLREARPVLRRCAAVGSRATGAAL
jgi:hypothetical protein